MLGLAAYLGPAARYDGLDLLPAQVDFANAAFATLPFPARFHLADVYNGTYNPSGKQRASEYRFPFSDATFDVVYAASLFTHLVPADAANYLKQTRRVLKTGGRALLSFFVLDHYRGPGTSAHPLYEFNHPLEDSTEVAVRFPESPETVIAFRSAWLHRAAADAGLSVVRIVPGLWSNPADFAVNEQDLVVLEATTRAT